MACPDVSGHVQEYPAELIKFRPAAYGIWWHDHRVLLSRSRFTQRWDLPGGGVEPFELLADGCRREFYEETGAWVDVGPLVSTAEGFIAFFGHPFHSLRFYFLVYGTPGPLTPAPDEISELSWWPYAEIPWDSMAASDQEALKKSVAFLPYPPA